MLICYTYSFWFTSLHKYLFPIPTIVADGKINCSKNFNITVASCVMSD